MSVDAVSANKWTIRGVFALIAWVALVVVYVRNYDIECHSGYQPAAPGQFGFGNRYFSFHLKRNTYEKIQVSRDGRTYVTLMTEDTMEYLGIEPNGKPTFVSIVPEDNADDLTSVGAVYHVR